MDKYSRVPVIDVHAENLEAIWPVLVESIHTSSLIALDTELSGLGNRKKLIAKSVEDRFKFMADVVKSRSILTLGISCFIEQEVGIMTQFPDNCCNSPRETDDNDNSSNSPRETDDNDSASLHNEKRQYKAKTFNLSVLCSEDFVVEPGSLQFLVQHGFDFNKQYSKGIPYTRGNDKTCHDYSTPSVRNLFSQIVISNKPIALHNGFFDLLYLYQSFYADVPSKLEVFLSDVYEMFTGGVIDTKYVAEYHMREPASYLGYIFRKCQRHNLSCKVAGARYTEILMVEDRILKPWIEELCCYANVKSHDSDGQTLQVCDLYASHGFCHKGFTCPLSHDMDLILDRDERIEHKKSKRKRKRKAAGNNETLEKSSSEVSRLAHDIVDTDRLPSNQHTTDTAGSTKLPTEKPSSASTSGGHRAGIDAFMTGYCLVSYMTKKRLTKLQGSEWVNRVSLSGKEMPLQIAKSHFAKASGNHSQKLKLIKGTK
ncbi:target of EGR1 protein 1 isoform X2 [Nematostella vectensis]|uniref:target of EGR1 protein 1 isoform X2 n=1 Tax=Nematostella vectensis TaxID=45351 RepID=UPI0020773E6A|nr:target of EGR1 protein 1 isoform X2 [Nematostella vectensis]